MSIVPTQEIRKLLADKKLRVDPLIDKKQISDSTIDIRLGTVFLFFRKEFLSVIDPCFPIDPLSEQYYFKKPGEPIVIHPNDFVLGTSLEYIALPDNILASVEGRSSWGRLGLFIATATTINPGYRGVITLEIVNSGTVPIHLYPGVRIAQLVLNYLEGKKRDESPYSIKPGAKFLGSLKPVFNKICSDPDWEIIRKQRASDGSRKM
jgi:dCTP deaminase